MSKENDSNNPNDQKSNRKIATSEDSRPQKNLDTKKIETTKDSRLHTNNNKDK